MRIKVIKPRRPKERSGANCAWLLDGPLEEPAKDTQRRMILAKEFRISHHQSEFIDRLRLVVTSQNPRLVISRSDVVQSGLDLLQLVAKACDFSAVTSAEDFRRLILERLRSSWSTRVQLDVSREQLLTSSSSGRL